MTDDDFGEKSMWAKKKSNLTSHCLTEAQLDELRAIVGPENVHTDDYNRLRVAYGKMMYDLIRLREKNIENLPDAVVSPRDKEDIRALVRWCNENRVPITPFGGGSSVMRGTECPHGGISLDMRVHMNKIIKLTPSTRQ